MTLLITVFAAIACTIVWYTKDTSKLRLGTLTLMFWGASLMWLVDAVVEYIEMGAEHFNAPLDAMLNDSFLGLSVVALGLAAWLVILLVQDPKGVLRKALSQRK
jgi:hypothetical protein